MTDYTFYVIALMLIAYVIYKKGTANNDYFSKRSLCSLKPKFLVGNLLNLYLRQVGVFELTENIYNSFKNEGIYGIFDFTSPILIVRDPEIVKQLSIKDFDYFEDHKLFLEPDTDRLFGNTLFMLRGEKWRDMRATLSPAFTGSKMRLMFDFIIECADQTKDYALKKCTANNGKLSVNVKEMFSLYTNDVIASCAFGIKVDSFKNRENEFFQNGKIATNFTNINSLFRILFLKFVPKLMKFLDIGFIDGRVAQFFRSMVLDTMAYRNEHNIFRPDMINILMDVKKGIQQQEQQQQQQQHQSNENDGFATVQESHIGRKLVKRKWTDDEIVAQCFLFFLAGYDTSSTVLSFIAYELALNKDVQEKLYAEVLNTYRSLNGKPLQYDTIQNMKYLDMVISEALRKYPALPVIDRLCVKDYQYKDNRYNFKIDKGVPYWIPITGFHYDPKYFPNPEKFDPERFNDENKHKINPSTYLPFGTGPRNCIGSRFALMEIKSLFYHTILNFSFEINDKTAIPLVFAKTPQFSVKNGIHLDLKQRIVV